MRVRAHLVTNYETEEEWLAARRWLVTASDAAAILGIDSHATAEQIFTEKTTGIGRGTSEPMTWGKRLQGAILAGFREDSGLDVHEQPAWLIRTHAVYPWLGCTLDGIVYETDRGTPQSQTVPVEIKNVNQFAKSAWTDYPPLRYQTQLAVQCAVLGASHGYLVALIGGQFLCWHRLEFPAVWFDLALPALAAFSARLEPFRPLDKKSMLVKLA